MVSFSVPACNTFCGRLIFAAFKRKCLCDRVLMVGIRLSSCSTTSYDSAIFSTRERRPVTVFPELQVPPLRLVFFLIAAFCRLAKSLSHSELMGWLVGAVGIEPRPSFCQLLSARNLLILRERHAPTELIEWMELSVRGTNQVQIAFRNPTRCEN
jgi:hypothetical protein